MNDEQTNVQNGHQVTIQNRSEQNSEPFRTNNQIVPQRSEQTTERSEDVPNEALEPHRSAQSCSEAHTEHTITVREAARIFEEAGVPRTERAITNWCNKNARGITRLAACYNEVERKYYLTPESIEEAIKEEKKKVQSNNQSESLFSAEAEDLSEHVRNEQQNDYEDVPNRAELSGEHSEREPNRTEQSGQNVPNDAAHEQPADTRSEPQSGESMNKLKELQMENYELRVQLEGQKHLIRKFDELTDKSNERHEREKMALVDRLTDARYQVGSLEQQLLQLEAPKGEVRDAEVETTGTESHQTVPNANVRETGQHQVVQ